MKLYWLDLETTGLDPRTDTILEIAMAEADLEDPFTLGPIAAMCFPVPERPLDPFILDMHTRNGLLAECARTSWRHFGAEERLMEMIEPFTTREDMPTLAGSSVHFDHAFLRVHMPNLAKRFSHRHYDVSAVKLFCRSLGMSKIPKAEAHRAADDIRESAAHGRLCAEWLDDHGYYTRRKIGSAFVG